MPEVLRQLPTLPTCYHPLLLFNREGDCLAARLRPGNVHSAEGWDRMLLPEVERQQRQGKDVVVRADAAFAKPELYEALEARGVKYAIRIPANDTLEQAVAELLRRPVGRPSRRPLVRYKSVRFLRVTSSRRRATLPEQIGQLSGSVFHRLGVWLYGLHPSRAYCKIAPPRDCPSRGSSR